MDSFRADLHVHTTFSDGTLSPLEVLKLAKELNLAGLSITDHDTVAAYTEEVMVEAERLGIRLLTGVEISARFEKESVHILGYGFSLHNPSLTSLLDKTCQERASRNRAILDKLRDLKLILNPEDLSNDLSKIGRPHIAYALVNKGYVPDIKSAFERYLGDGAAAFVPFLGQDCRLVIETLHQAQGKAVLAHPHFLSLQFVERILDLPFDGLEVYYGRLLADQERRFSRLAEERGLISTGGSDFHGMFKPSIPLGASWVTEEIFEKLR